MKLFICVLHTSSILHATPQNTIEFQIKFPELALLLYYYKNAARAILHGGKHEEYLFLSREGRPGLEGEQSRWHQPLSGASTSALISRGCEDLIGQTKFG